MYVVKAVQGEEIKLFGEAHEHKWQESFRLTLVCLFLLRDLAVCHVGECQRRIYNKLVIKL